MNELLPGVLLPVAYLIGSIPFGPLIARFVKGVDLREQGSRNTGATNVARVIGKKWGLLCLTLDFLKGVLATGLLPRLVAQDAWVPWIAAGCGAATILGHSFPVWLGFRGGKGVATGAGVALVLSPGAALAAIGAFLLAFGCTRIVSLGSVVAAGVYAITALLLMERPVTSAQWPLITFALLMPGLILLRHRGNIARLLRGEEHRFGTQTVTTPSEPGA